MKNTILIVPVLMLLTGCASLRYPNWEKVSIETSVENKPCAKAGIKEQCTASKGECEPWFKKRATLVSANTTVINRDSANNRFIGTYFQCHTGIPPYKTPKFNAEEYKSGSNTVTGQAFLTQNGGGVVTCAGQPVFMHPDTEYFEDYDNDTSGLSTLTSEAADFIKSSQCDAQGNFEFHKIPAGKWVVSVSVNWNVYSVESFGNNYYTAERPQGGRLERHVTVQNGEINKFIITR